MVDWLNIDILINENKKDLTELEELIGHRFTDLRLLECTDSPIVCFWTGSGR